MTENTHDPYRQLVVMLSAESMERVRKANEEARRSYRLAVITLLFSASVAIVSGGVLVSRESSLSAACAATCTPLPAVRHYDSSSGTNVCYCRSGDGTLTPTKEP